MDAIVSLDNKISAKLNEMFEAGGKPYKWALELFSFTGDGVPWVLSIAASLVLRKQISGYTEDLVQPHLRLFTMFLVHVMFNGGCKFIFKRDRPPYRGTKVRSLRSLINIFFSSSLNPSDFRRS
eukprot:TRINITY_DN2198_c0_g2_i4.p2 TRINITY_DN2198_c0_g2~~TRINITY_DN2198_c0_g2_i4.p2  ORF type:complete len:124 (+),score=31.07 TRINITY_DN2198_c0_g2_i4:641-1012(+)